MSQAVLYEHSGRGLGAGVAASLFVAFPAILALAVVYAVAVAFIPIVGYVTFLLAGGFGWSAAWVMGKTLRWAKARHSALPMFATVALVVLAYGFSWVVWTYSMLASNGVTGIGFVELMLPWNLVIIMIEISRVGAWSIMGFVPTGVVLWLLWAAEAVLVIGAAVYGVRSFGVIEPFCERCNQFCMPETALATIPAVNSQDLGERILARDFAVLEETFEDLGEGYYHILQSSRCPSCDEMATLSLYKVTPRVDEQGQPNDLIEPVVRRLLATTADLQTIDGILESLSPERNEPSTTETDIDEYQQSDAVPA